MAIIDKFVQALVEFRADRVTLFVGQPVTLYVGDSKRAITAQAPTPHQIQSLLMEIAPTPMHPRLFQDGTHDFDYSAPAGEVEVNVQRHNGVFNIQCKPKSVDLQLDSGAHAPAQSAPIASVSLKKIAVRADAPEIEKLLIEMVEADCSDLHLCSHTPPMFRHDGEMKALSRREPLGESECRDLIWGIMPPRNREEFEATHDTDFAYEIPKVARFRCNVFLDRKGIGAVFRQIPARILTVEDLGLSAGIVNLCNLSKGLVVVTGPTGSGKSTTLAAMIDYINKRRKDHIITIEDPIEFVHENHGCLINQREVGPHTDGFKRALRAALREDPDVVLVGEMRDLETVHIALETAETGHLVFGTLHTTTAASTIDRIIDQFPAGQQAQIRTMLSESLKGVISQTLLKKNGGGRVAAHEVLVVTNSVSNLIREGKTFQITSLMQTGKSMGMVTMNDSLLTLVKDGVVAPEEAYHKAVAKNELKAALAKLGHHVE